MSDPGLSARDANRSTMQHDAGSPDPTPDSRTGTSRHPLPPGPPALLHARAARAVGLSDSKAATVRNSFGCPGDAQTGAHDGVVELLRRRGALFCHANHALGAATSLSSRFTHPGLYEPLLFEPIDRGVERTDR